MYLVGKDDGSLDVCLARVSSDGTIMLPKSGRRMVIDEYDWTGWWWRPMVVPPKLPSDQFLRSLPSVRGGL